MTRTMGVALAGLAALVMAASADGRAVTIQADAAHSGNAGADGPPAHAKRRWLHRVTGHPGYAVIGGGRVFVPIRANLRPGEVHALAARDGRVLWRYTLEGDAAKATLAYADGRVFVAGDSGLVALDAGDGRVLWQLGGVGVTTEPPVAVDGVVYADAQSNLGVAVRQSDGAVLWLGPVGQGVRDGPTVAGGTVYYTSGNCVLHALRVDGQPLFSTADDCRASYRGFPAVHAGRVYVPLDSRYGVPNVLSPADGVKLGTVQTHLPAAFAGDLGVFADGRRPGEVIVGPHTLVARRLPDGRPRWRFRGDGYLDTPPLIAGRRVYVGSGAGRVFGLALGSGRVRWRGRVGRPLESTDLGAPAGLAAGEGILVVPAAGRVVAFG